MFNINALQALGYVLKVERIAGNVHITLSNAKVLNYTEAQYAALYR